MLLALYMLSKLSESDRWAQANTAPEGGTAAHRAAAVRAGFFGELFAQRYRRRTWLNAGLVTVSIIGLWAGAVYEPSAIVNLAKRAGHTPVEATRLASFGTGLLSIGTVLGCLVAPVLAERLGRRWALGVYFLGMAICIWPDRRGCAQLRKCGYARCRDGLGIYLRAAAPAGLPGDTRRGFARLVGLNPRR